MVTILTNAGARSLAEECANELSKRLGDNLFLVMLFGSTFKGKAIPKDVDLLVVTKNRTDLVYSPPCVDITYRSLEEVANEVEGRGISMDGGKMIRRLFLGEAEVIYDPNRYYASINNAFASRNPSLVPPLNN